MHKLLERSILIKAQQHPPGDGGHFSRTPRRVKRFPDTLYFSLAVAAVLAALIAFSRFGAKD